MTGGEADVERDREQETEDEGSASIMWRPTAEQHRLADEAQTPIPHLKTEEQGIREHYVAPHRRSCLEAQGGAAPLDILRSCSARMPEEQ